MKWIVFSQFNSVIVYIIVNMFEEVPSSYYWISIICGKKMVNIAHSCSVNHAACSPGAPGLISRFWKLFSAGLRKEEDKSSTDHHKAAEDYDGYGPVVHGQRVEHRRQQACYSKGHGAQANRCLPESGDHFYRQCICGICMIKYFCFILCTWQRWETTPECRPYTLNQPNWKRTSQWLQGLW